MEKKIELVSQVVNFVHELDKNSRILVASTLYGVAAFCIITGTGIIIMH